MQQNSNLRINCTALLSDGRGLARDKGRVVMCAGLVPGDVADVLVEDTKASVWEAQLVDLITPSPNRVTPVCIHAQDCGGCPWMIMDMPTQTQWKTQAVRDAFARIGKCEDIPLQALIVPELLLGQRTKMEYAFANAADGLRLGLRRRASHEVVAVTACLQQSTACMNILATVRDVAKDSGLPAWDGVQKEGFWRFVVLRETSQGTRLLECIVGEYQNDMRATRSKADAMMQALTTALRTSGTELPAIVFSVRKAKTPVAYGERRLCSQGAITLVEQVGDLTLDMAHDAFFQVHRVGTKHLYDTIAAHICPPDLVGKGHVWDVYCGVGSIGLYVANMMASVSGMDNVPAAVTQANRNAKAYAIKHDCDEKAYNFFLGEAKHGLSTLTREQKKGHISKADVIVFDPPRAGLSSRITEDILKLEVPRIVLVSCNPATLARDVLLLRDKYALESVHMIEMFPHTPHVECVAILQKK